MLATNPNARATVSNHSESPFKSHLSTDTVPDLRNVIAQSAEVREASRSQRLQRMLQALLDTTLANPPATTTAFEQLLGSILDAVMIATEAHMGNMQLVDPGSQALRIRVHRGFSPAFLQFFGTVPHGAYVCGVAFAQGGPLVVEDIVASGLYEGEALRQVIAANIKGVQSLPLVHQGRPLGVISVHYHSGGIPPRSRETFASTATLIAAIVAAGSVRFP